MDSYVQFWHLQNSSQTKLDFEHNKQIGGSFQKTILSIFFPARKTREPSNDQIPS